MTGCDLPAAKVTSQRGTYDSYWHANVATLYLLAPDTGLYKDDNLITYDKNQYIIHIYFIINVVWICADTSVNIARKRNYY